MKDAWTEFKTAVLPWLLAGAVVVLLQAAYAREAENLRKALAAQAVELGRIHDLIAQQGYISAPVSTTTVVAPSPTPAARPRSK